MSLSQESLGTNTNQGGNGRRSYYRASSRRWSKNQMNRRMRRAAKRDPENALRRKQYRGWP